MYWESRGNCNFSLCNIKQHICKLYKLVILATDYFKPVHVIDVLRSWMQNFCFTVQVCVAQGFKHSIYGFIVLKRLKYSKSTANDLLYFYLILTLLYYNSWYTIIICPTWEHRSSTISDQAILSFATSCSYFLVLPIIFICL